MKKLTTIAATLALTAGLAAAPVLTASAWESVGLRTQYPSEGGTWQYGFQNVMLRSYYTVGRCHGSTVYRKIDGRIVNISRSVNTAPNQRSVAEVWTVNSPGLDGQYFYRTC